LTHTIPAPGTAVPETALAGNAPASLAEAIETLMRFPLGPAAARFISQRSWAVES